MELARDRSMGSFLPPSLSPLLLVIILSVVAAPPRTDAWGTDGHFMVCKIAQDYLSEEAARAVEVLLRGERLEEVCSWADNVRRQYPWSAPLHYVNNPTRTCDFVHARDCPNNECVVGAIDDEASYLRETYYLNVTPPTSSRDLSLSLKFLAHFVGDVHQPLHVAFKRDSGGNAIENIRISWRHKFWMEKNLHKVWDTTIIRIAIRQKYRNDRERMIESIKGSIQPDEWTRASLSPAAYASESIAMACAHAYNNTLGCNIRSKSTLKETYCESGLTIMEDRIARGAVRLAGLLNDIFYRPQTDSASQV